MFSLALIAGCGRFGFDPVADSSGDGPDAELPWPTLAGQWTWMGGAVLGAQAGSYGARGVPATSNMPGARDNGASWLVGDTFWVFGGYGFGAAGGSNRLNDLWRYELPTGHWTWMHGPTATMGAGIYGSKGIPAPSNQPGARNDGVGWVGDDGNLWTFGGGGYDELGTFGVLGDLWRYDLATGEWTCMGGSVASDQLGIYGTRGVADPLNAPGGRSSAQIWATENGAWLFGGLGFGRVGAQGSLADLWRYDRASNAWTWVAGPDVVDELPSYGALGTPSTSNQPGGRYGACAWTSPDELWLFGGSGAAGRSNDVWRYTISTGVWTWMAGPSAVLQPGVYGTRGVSSPSTTPGARVSQRCWQDLRGNFWLLGGSALDVTGANGPMNDLWLYAPAIGEWTWVAGADRIDQRGRYGMQGIPDPANTLGSRRPAAAWATPDGSFWLFGGDGAFDSLGPTPAVNDMWRFAAP